MDGRCIFCGEWITDGSESDNDPLLHRGCEFPFAVHVHEGHYQLRRYLTRQVEFQTWLERHPR